MKKILHIGNKLEKHGFTPTSVDSLPPLLEKEGYCVKTMSSFKNKPLRLVHMLGGIVCNRDVKLVLIDTYSTLNFWYAVLCGKLCRLLNIPYAFILHGGDLEQRFASLSATTLEVFKDAHHNIVPSKFLLEKLRKFRFNNFVHIPNTIPLSEYTFKKRINPRPALLWVRAFHETYNPGMLLKVMELLSRSFPEAHACMVGPDKDGSLQKMKQFSRERGLNIKFKGKLSKQEWIDLSKDYDLFLNTARVDNTPVSLIEAMALGLPIVSTNVGGIPYLISHHHTGLLVDPGNAGEMAAAVKELLLQSGLANQISENARREAGKFDWEEVKFKWLELLG